jgi:hemolysin D
MTSSMMKSSLSPWLELAKRYRAVLAAAWEVRHELAGPKRLADEVAFLPAAMSLQETPVHPAPRRAMWAVMAFVLIALCWSVLGQVDIVAVANGRIVVGERTKTIQPLETSVVTAILVKDGDHVEAGQVLVELDATGATADHANVSEQLRAAQGEMARTEHLLAALSSGRSPSRIEDAHESSLLQAEWLDIAARVAQLDAESEHRKAELATLQEVRAKLEATLPLTRQREADFKSLTEQGFVAGHAGQDRTRERIEQERDLAAQRARIREAESAAIESARSKAAYLAETRRSLTDRLAAATLKAAQLQQESAKAIHREGLTRLTAPVAGTVQQRAVNGVGAVVTEAQPLMVIVPADAEVIAEVIVDNKDIGFVREGQHAEVKFETFNFTRYGTVPATVQWVSADAVQDEKRGAVFTATLRLHSDRLDVDGKAIRLAPGMNVSAEVKTGKRRVIDYLMSPIQQTAQESIRER